MSSPHPEDRRAGTDQTEDDEQTARIQALLASVRDITSSLHLMSGQLEREVRAALDQDPGTDTADRVAALEVENAQLRQALEGRAVIEQAKGMLMGRHDLHPDHAFDVLVALSRRQKRKVREVAADLVAGVTDQRPRTVELPAEPHVRSAR